MLAHAASSKRAQHGRASGCTLNIHTGILDCLTEDFVQNDTVTPFGNEGFHAHGTITDTESLGGTAIS
jgi:hypothetical protein